ncbi:hypothetical protein KUTeg_005539 [Tegillarca granosa]|uniref:NHR domain-containing protein n=1 Tax=Tegillarca granosa TaxID=220873 RepID=A0ABQ9FN01_TEGGR|nr:hypothetical protein KUTeg_005539 [Tegillarca granosa]
MSTGLSGDLASISRGDWPLKFHAVKGDNVELTHDRARARRADSFCKAICFSSRPIAVNEKVYVKFVDVSSSWSGVLRFGFTSIDPATQRGSDLPRYACPDLTNKPGNWAKALTERYAALNNVLHFYVTRNGDVIYGVNGEDIGQFFNGVSTNGPLWALFDIYGNTLAVEFVQLEPRRLNNMVTPPPQGNTPMNYVQELTTQFSSLGTTEDHSTTPPQTASLPGLRHYNNVSLKPIHFHMLTGRNVHVNQDRSIAVRAQDEYCNSYVFSSRPIRCGEKIILQVLGVDRSYVGGLAFGCTACDPSKVKPEELPDDSDLLLDRPEYWVVNKDVCRFPEVGDELCFHLTLEGVASHVPPVPPRPRSTSYIREPNLTVALPPRDQQPVSQNVTNANAGLYQQQPSMLRSFSVPSGVMNTGGMSSPPTISKKPPMSLPTSPNPRDSIEESESEASECTVCYERPANAVLYTCGHLCMCFECAQQARL